MPTKFTGKLYVESRTGAYGRFNIAKLVTEIGEFAVKNKAVEELDEGAYSGSFVVGKVFLATTRLRSGAVITELRARVDDYALLEDGEVPESVEIGTDEQDPIVEDDAPPPVDTPQSEPEDKDAPSNDEDALKELFGEELLPLGVTVTLDPSTDRGQFRRQRDYLKDNNYKYVPDRKVWELQQED